MSRLWNKAITQGQNGQPFSSDSTYTCIIAFKAEEMDVRRGTDIKNQWVIECIRIREAFKHVRSQ